MVTVVFGEPVHVLSALRVPTQAEYSGVEWKLLLLMAWARLVAKLAAVVPVTVVLMMLTPSTFMPVMECWLSAVTTLTTPYAAAEGDAGFTVPTNSGVVWVVSKSFWQLV